MTPTDRWLLTSAAAWRTGPDFTDRGRHHRPLTTADRRSCPPTWSGGRAPCGDRYMNVAPDVPPRRGRPVTLRRFPHGHGAYSGRATDESACTPGSVHGGLAASRWAVIHLGPPLPAGSSGPPAGIGRAALERLRRTASGRPGRRPFRPCSGWGLPSHTGHPVCGGLLHRRFTLAGASSEDATPAVCSLWHCPAGHPGSPLATTLPCGARTFLGGGSPRRRDRPADSSVVPASLDETGSCKITSARAGPRRGG